MPLSPIDVLKRLQTNPAAELPDVDANDPATLYGQLDRNATELSHNLVNNTPAIQPEETAYGPKGPIGQGFGNRENHGMPTFTSGGNVADLKSFLDDMKSSPVETERPGLAATAEANRVAQTQGFTGGRNIALDRSDPHAPAGEISAAMSVPSAPPAAQAAGNQRQMDLTKLLSPLAVEQEKNKGALELGQQNFVNALRAHGLDPNNPTGRGATPSTPATPATPPLQGNTGLQGVEDFFTGNGPLKYNGVTDMASAALDRQLSKVASTPFTPLVQENSFANLQQLSGMFPGVRGFGYLLPKLAEHQANFGKETPVNSYNRGIELNRMLDDTERELSDPSNLIRTGANGAMSFAAEPQMILRAKQAIAETRNQNQRMMQHLQQQYPGIGGPNGPMSAVAPAAASTPQADPYANPNWGR